MKENDIEVNDLENVNPSPYLPRLCLCCGREFQPTRSDHDCIDKKHTDRNYYQTVTKPKNAERNKIEKIQRQNDRILSKYFKTGEGDQAICFWESILADGFDENYIQGTDDTSPVPYAYTYSFKYTLINDDGFIKIKIFKK